MLVVNFEKAFCMVMPKYIFLLICAVFIAGNCSGAQKSEVIQKEAAISIINATSVKEDTTEKIEKTNKWLKDNHQSFSVASVLNFDKLLSKEHGSAHDAAAILRTARMINWMNVGLCFLTAVSCSTVLYDPVRASEWVKELFNHNTLQIRAFYATGFFASYYLLRSNSREARENHTRLKTINTYIELIGKLQKKC